MGGIWSPKATKLPLSVAVAVFARAAVISFVEAVYVAASLCARTRQLLNHQYARAPDSGRLDARARCGRRWNTLASGLGGQSPPWARCMACEKRTAAQNSRAKVDFGPS